MKDVVLDLLYPNVCGVCNVVCKESLCKKCEISLSSYHVNRVVYGVGKYFDSSVSVFKYEGIIRKKIIEYKYGDKAYLYKFFSKIISKNVKIFGLFENNYDIIIPVPIYKKKKRIRGYNQTELIAREISSEVDGLEYCDDVLLKIIDTNVQSLLSKKERKSNIKDVFEVNYKYIEKIRDKRIILFDDIYTTGSTVNECSRILKKYGVSKILVLTLAKDELN